MVAVEGAALNGNAQIMCNGGDKPLGKGFSELYNLA